MIVTLTDSLLQRLKPDNGRIVRDRLIVGFCVRLYSKRRSFFIATSCCGEQVRVTIGYYPLIKTEEARAAAVEIIKQCRAGTYSKHSEPAISQMKSLKDILPQYIKDKGLKSSSEKRYDSIMRTHFADWYERPVNELSSTEFSQHCHQFVQSKTVSITEMGRAFIGAITKYINAIYGLNLVSPFHRLAAAGLMTEKVQPRKRKLQEADLPTWYQAVSKLPERQRDGLMFLAMTGLRRNEGLLMKRCQVDFDKGIIHIPHTKTGRPHSLPITPVLNEILQRRCERKDVDELVFAGISTEHLADMAKRQGAPEFMLHDLRKLLATVGERLQISDSTLRRILNHTSGRSDTLYRHYVSIELSDIRKPLMQIQRALLRLMH